MPPASTPGTDRISAPTTAHGATIWLTDRPGNTVTGRSPADVALPLVERTGDTIAAALVRRLDQGDRA